MHFSTYQRKMWRVMGHLTVGRHYFLQDEAGNYTIKKVPKPVLIYYYTLWINTFIKVTYLYLTYHGYTKEVHFLDQMSMWDYAFCFSQIFQETIMWFGKYPLYEVLIANWKLQDEIFKKLGSPQHVNDTINKSVRTLVWLHSGIVTVGVTSLMVQYFADPKYALNTYALFDYESFPLLLLFGLHEFLFVYHTWINQATSIHLPEIFAVTYTPLLIEMTKVMYTLIDVGEVQGMQPVKSKPGKENISVQQEKGNAENKNTPKEAESNNTHKEEVLPDKIERYYPVRKILHPQTKAPGTDYDIDGLLRDYKKLMLAGNAFNKWVGKKMAGIIASNMCTFISDVWMTIQLLREPDFTLLGLYFFFEDSCAGIVILFKMLLVMSRMYPASEEFLHSFKSYLQYDNPRRKYLLKYQKTFKIVTGNIGGYGTRPESVPKGVHAIMSYYIAAAMWRRPVDRLT